MTSIGNRLNQCISDTEEWLQRKFGRQLSAGMGRDSQNVFFGMSGIVLDFQEELLAELEVAADVILSQMEVRGVRASPA